METGWLHSAFGAYDAAAAAFGAFLWAVWDEFAVMTPLNQIVTASALPAATIMFCLARGVWRAIAVRAP